MAVLPALRLFSFPTYMKVVPSARGMGAALYLLKTADAELALYMCYRERDTS